jgi:hypothetical protein
MIVDNQNGNKYIDIDREPKKNKAGIFLSGSDWEFRAKPHLNAHDILSISLPTFLMCK